VIVGDRGMLTEANIRKELKPVSGLDWISALRGPSIKKLVNNEYLQLSLFDGRDLAAITSPDYPGERLIVCRNPLLAEERTVKREELLKATEKKLDEIQNATKRKRNPLKGKSEIGISVGKNINKYKMAKHFSVKITDDNMEYQRKTVRNGGIGDKEPKLLGTRSPAIRPLALGSTATCGIHRPTLPIKVKGIVLLVQIIFAKRKL